MVYRPWAMGFCLHEDSHHKWSLNFKDMRVSAKVLRVRVTATTQLGALFTNCNPIVEGLTDRIKDREAPSISFAVSVL